jgi:hypothetical protein
VLARIRTGHFGFAAVGLHRRAIPVSFCIEGILARLAQHHGRVRRFDLHGFVRCERMHMHRDRAVGEAHQQRVVVERDEREPGVFVEVYGGRAHLHFGAPAAIDPHAISGGDRTIQQRVGPVVAIGRRERHAAVDEAQARDAIGRIDFVFGTRHTAAQQQAEQDPERSAESCVTHRHQCQ